VLTVQQVRSLPGVGGSMAQRVSELVHTLERGGDAITPRALPVKRTSRADVDDDNDSANNDNVDDESSLSDVAAAANDNNNDANDENDGSESDSDQIRLTMANVSAKNAQRQAAYSAAAASSQRVLAPVDKTKKKTLMATIAQLRNVSLHTLQVRAVLVCCR
jgi:hypothetical protein